MTSARNASPAACSDLPERQATPTASTAAMPGAFHSPRDCDRDGYRGPSKNQPALHDARDGDNYHFASRAGNSDDPTRTGQTPGAEPNAPGHSAEAFIADWIAPQPSRVYVNPPRREYGPQYNGVGECPF